jgi:protoporphyrinogen oxidase
MSDTRVLILGAGPAGIGAAQRLQRLDRGPSVVIEQDCSPGGSAGSFSFGGQRLDFGSHRLHPSCDPKILSDIRQLLGVDLLDRPRHGRIRLRGRWIHFPLQPADLFSRIDKSFAIQASMDVVRKALGLGTVLEETFAGILWRNLGPAICREFYFPYARKIWGVEPERLSAVQARRRIAASSFTGLAKKVIGALPGLKKPGFGRFFYPRYGFGQIVEAFSADAQRQGARLLYQHCVERIVPPPSAGMPWTVIMRHGDEVQQVEAEYLWSTIPITTVVKCYAGVLPPEVNTAIADIRFRAMILVYLQLDVERFTEYDAHYLPEAAVRITRLSEPKNYCNSTASTGSTVLCAELPCTIGDDIWQLDDESLGRLVVNDLASVGLPLQRPPISVLTRRLRHAYPIYLHGYEHQFNILDAWADSLPCFLTFGRLGLFAHDNTHHALRMSYAAVDCLGPSGFDAELWRTYRREFERHVVED